MSKQSERKWGCLKAGLVAILGFVILNSAVNWWHSRPKQLLNRFLDVSWSDRITRLETSFVGGMDYTAHIYLEADAKTIEDILSKGNFAKMSDRPRPRFDSQLNFEGAPDSRSESLIRYHKHEGSVIENAARSKDGRRLWYGAFDY